MIWAAVFGGFVLDIPRNATAVKGRAAALFHTKSSLSSYKLYSICVLAVLYYTRRVGLDTEHNRQHRQIKSRCCHSTAQSQAVFDTPTPESPLHWLSKYFERCRRTAVSSTPPPCEGMVGRPVGSTTVNKMPGKRPGPRGGRRPNFGLPQPGHHSSTS